MRILNLYAGIGGNRKLWGDRHDIVAVELDPQIAEVYADLWPQDTTVVADAHKYLLAHFREFDFIWSSPPCQSHSQWNRVDVKLREATPPRYPDMKLYEEILLLQHIAPEHVHWVVENVISYYEPLIRPQTLNRHYYWANFTLPATRKVVDGIRSKNSVSALEEHHGFDLSAYTLPNKRQVLRNVVHPETALDILKTVETIKGGEVVVTQRTASTLW